MRFALDATYSLGDALSGVGVYSREILQGSAAAAPQDTWDWFYRPRRYRGARVLPTPPNVKIRILTDILGNRSASLFHGLNQRLPRRRFQRQVVTYHDLFVFSGDYSTPSFRERFMKQARGAAAGADLIIAVSAFTASQVEQYLAIPASRIRVIHHGVLPRKIPKVRREKVVLCVGAIQKRKNQASLVRAFRALAEDWTLVLAGSNGYGAEETLSAIAASPCASRILVTGYLQDHELAAWYGKASIFAFPSFDEGFGMPVLEAMAAGIPVIAGSRSALPEVAGKAALLIDPNDENHLAYALTLLSKNENLREEFTVLGKARAAEFRWPQAVRHTLAAYREIVSTPAS